MKKENLKAWWIGATYWNGKPMDYVCSDEPAPKEAFKVVVFFVVPWIAFLLVLLKYFK